MKKRYNFLTRLTLLTILSVVLISTFSNSAQAVTANDWKAGNIINDTLFSDGDGMSVAQIQAFLVRLLPSCDKWGSKTSELGGGTRAQYGASVGNPAPFTCITNYYEVPKTSPSPNIPVNNYGQYNPDGSTVIPAGSKSTAQLIYDAGQQYSINPKALIIKLATESSGPLTSDDWPLKKQFYYAMGAHCPDSGPGGSANCNINYSGFSMQIAESARLLRSYLDGMTQSWWSYKKPYQNNNILWNVVERNCGSSNVYIETKATAALYTYTPYQPNAAALNNMYGTGDNCSAYGNRNFWRVWNDWFGSTQEPGYTPFFQIPGSVATYVLGANKTYYAVNDYQRLVDYGFEGPFKLRVKQIEQSALTSYTFKGNLPAIARFEGIGVFLAIDGKLRPVPSEEILQSYGYALGQEATLTKEVADVLPQGDALWNVAGTTGGGATYYVSGGKKQAMCSWDVYTNLGTPVYSSQPITSLPARYLSSISNGALIAMDGDVIESSDKSVYGVWSNGLFIPMNANTARSSGAINCGAPSDAVNLLPKSSQTIDNIVSNGAGSLYVLEGQKKLVVNQQNTAALNIPTQQFTQTTDKFLEKLASSSLSKLVRVNGGAGVYLIDNGKSYGIPSEADLYGLGFNFDNVQDVSNKTFSLTTQNGLVFKPGSIVRETSSLELYMIDSQFKRHYISSESILLNYGYRWSDVRVVPNGSLNGYSIDDPLRYYIKENESLYWIMDRGVKRRIPVNLVASNYYNLTEDKYTDITIPVLTQYPMAEQLGRVFRAGTGVGVYTIENGTKRAFTNESAFFARGYTWQDVTSLNPDYVNQLPTGSYITQ